MGTSATKAKRKYNEKNYKRFEVRLKPELFEQIEKFRSENNISRSQFLEMAISVLGKE